MIPFFNLGVSILAFCLCFSSIRHASRSHWCWDAWIVALRSRFLSIWVEVRSCVHLRMQIQVPSMPSQVSHGVWISSLNIAWVDLEVPVFVPVASIDATPHTCVLPEVGLGDGGVQQELEASAGNGHLPLLISDFRGVVCQDVLKSARVTHLKRVTCS